MAIQELIKERVEFATRREHFEQAFRVVYQEYLKKGYCARSPSTMRISLHNALPDTAVFCLWRKSELLATASLIFDSPLGLPMENVYPQEIQSLRKTGRKLCEVSLLALNSKLIRKGILPIYLAERLRCLYQIFKPVFWYARGTMGSTDLCIAMNPVHKFLYNSLYFEQFGEERIYESVNGNPSIAMRLNFDGIEERSRKTPGLYKLFLGKRLELKKVSDVFMWTKEDFRYFFLEHSDVLQKAKPEQINHLISSYPEFQIEEMIRVKKQSVHFVSAQLNSSLGLEKTAYQPASIPNKPLSLTSLIKAKYQDGRNQPRNIKIRNLSRGGICIEDEVRLPKGTSIRLLLNVKGKTIEAQGEVAWNASAGPPFLHGIKFTFMEQKGREWFNTFVMDSAAEQIADELDFSGLATVATEGEFERRSFARLKIPLRIDVGLNKDVMLFQAQIYDLSEGGACLISSFMLKEGQELKLRLWLNDQEFILLTGIIKYSAKKTHEQRHVNFYGVEFLKSNREALEKIAHFLRTKRSELAAIEITLDDIIAGTHLPEIP